MYFFNLLYTLNKQSMYINKHNCFVGICPFIWSTLTALANTSAKLSNHKTQGLITDILSNTCYVLNYFDIERLKSLYLAIMSPLQIFQTRSFDRYFYLKHHFQVAIKQALMR